MDNPKYKICNVNDDIYSHIIKYNEGRISCSEWKQKLEARLFIDSLIHVNDLKIATELYIEREKERTLDTYLINHNSI